LTRVRCCSRRALPGFPAGGIQIHPRWVAAGERSTLLAPPLQGLVALVPSHLPARVDQAPPRRITAVARHHHPHHPRTAPAGGTADRLGDHSVRGGAAL